MNDITSTCHNILTFDINCTTLKTYFDKGAIQIRALFNFSHALLFKVYFFVQVIRCSFFFGGGGGGLYYKENLKIYGKFMMEIFCKNR